MFSPEQFKTLAQVAKLSHFDCLIILIDARWGDEPVCPYCKEHHKAYLLKTGSLKCSKCRRKYSPLVGTIFQDSKIPLNLWFYAIHYLATHPKGCSSCQLAKNIGVCQKTAWFMLHRVRAAMSSRSFEIKASGEFEADETYVGGKEKNKHKSKQTEGTQGRSTKTKEVVFGLFKRESVDTETGEVTESEVWAYVVPDSKQATLQGIIEDKVEPGSTINTDEHHAYKGLTKAGYEHQTVEHGQRVYVVDTVHTNGMENFWSLFKRGVYGIYHHLSKKHLGRYLTEFTYRFNRKKQPAPARFLTILKQAVCCYLSFKKLVA